MPASTPNQIGSDLLLVHEGNADLKILGNLVRRLEITGFQFMSLKGLTNRRAFFKGLALSPHFRSPVPGYDTPVRAIAVVVDAETDAAATFRGTRDALRNAGLPSPDAPGDIAARDALRVGVYLLPDNQAPGMIETLCLQSVAADPAWHCLEGFFRCVEKRGGTLPINMHKARAQAFLSTRTQPELPVGRAADEGYWNLKGPAFAPLADFLREMAR